MGLELLKAHRIYTDDKLKYYRHLIDKKLQIKQIYIR